MSLFEAVKAEAAALQLPILKDEAIASIEEINTAQEKAKELEVLVETENSFAALGLAGTESETRGSDGAGDF